MCLILFAHHSHPKYPLILASNRDEFHGRPTKTLHWWEDDDILAGRDLKAGGTWMGVNRSGKVAAITNYRQFPITKEYSSSRGELVRNFLTKDLPPESYLEILKNTANNYDGYNLIFGTMNELFYFSNRSENYGPIEKGIHGLSNHLLNTSWPKVERGKQKLDDIIKNEDLEKDRVMNVLLDKSRAGDQELPDTGIGLEKERQLSSIFIEGNNYGTRASNFLIIDHEGQIKFFEKSHIPSEQSEFNFQIG